MATVTPVSVNSRSLARRLPWRAALTVAVAGYLVLSAVLLGLGLLIVEIGPGTGIEAFDDSTNSWIAERRTGVLDALSGVFSALADTWTIVGAAFGAVCAWVPGRAWRRATALVAGLLIEICAFLSVTYVVGRERPTVEYLGGLPSTGSFPSGHIAAAIVLYGGLAWLASSLIRSQAIRRALLVAGLMLVPAGVGWARWYRGMHHPTDLIGGVLLGCAALYLGVLVARRLFPADHDDATEQVRP